MHRPEKDATTPWHFPVMLEEVPETGKRFELVANPDTRAAIARTAELRDLPRLDASFEVRRQGVGGFRVPAGYLQPSVKTASSHSSRSPMR